MVEGPGCTLNGEKIRARVTRGQSVRELGGSAVSGTSKKSPSNASSVPSNLTPLISSTYTGVQTLGKELFVYFEAKALRNASECQEKVCLFEDLDVSSPKFSFSRAECEVKKQGCRMLCDVLLDQAVLPGVGNIIKNEALFDSGLHPAVQAASLTDGQISLLVKMTRDFTLLFYKCRKNGMALYKHYKVYKRSNCGQCGTKITVCRLGEHNRMTYFCAKCQKNNPQQLDVSKLPCRNSLIGWACRQESHDQVARSDEEHWACQVCTLINKPSDQKCDACLTPKPQVLATSANENAGFDTDLIKYPCNQFGKSLSEMKINRRTAFGHTTLVLSDFCSKANVDNEDNHCISSLERSVSHTFSNTFNVSNKRRSMESEQQIYTCNAINSSPGTGVSHSFVQHQKRQKTDHLTPNFQNEINKAISSPRVNQTGTTSSHGSSTLCSKHKKPCVLQVVRKDGENKGRQFYSCSLPKESRCEFFEWADLHFPFCNHGKRCIMRTVLKIGPNNGKNFYVCALGRDKQCDFFQWAKD
ncbi:endonuclease 8-like 3 isoform 2-T2 [Mantella aurantiaca]